MGVHEQKNCRLLRTSKNDDDTQRFLVSLVKPPRTTFLRSLQARGGAQRVAPGPQVADAHSCAALAAGGGQAVSRRARLQAAPLPRGLRCSQPLASLRAHRNLNFFFCC